MKRIIAVVLPVVALTAAMVASGLAATTFASPAFQQQWAEGESLAPNFWGPLANATGGLYEPYQQATGGVRLVQYFDKGRMELTNGTVTNGLLATELTTGQMQMGDAQFQFRPPPETPIAGDQDGPGPTYAGLFRNGQALFASVSPAIGAPVSIGVLPNGSTAAPIVLPGPAQTIGTFDSATSHNVAAVFADYRNRVNLLTIGFAKTEPFTMTAKVAGVARPVMAQVFERRILTYTPGNPPDFLVEMANIGQQYYGWRYQATPPTPTPAPPTASAPRYTTTPQRTNLTQTAATFEWVTDQPTTSRVEYDTEQNRVDYRFAVGSTTNFTTGHSVTLTNLSPSTVYFVRFVGTNTNGQLVEPPTTSSFQTPATTPPPGAATTITSPTSGQRVSSPLTVSGKEDGTAFEGNLVVRLRDRNTGATLVSQPTTAQRPGTGQPGTFQVTLSYVEPPADTPGVVEVLTPPVQDTDSAQLRASVNVVIAARPNSPATGALNVRWQWTSTVETQSPTPQVVPNPPDYTIIFRPGGMAEIKADCNTITGTYVADGFGNLSISTLGPSTMVACGDQSLDQKYLAELSEVRGYSLSGGSLTLYFGANNNRMTFQNGGTA